MIHAFLPVISVILSMHLSLMPGWYPGKMKAESIELSQKDGPKAAVFYKKPLIS